MCFTINCISGPYSPGEKCIGQKDYSRAGSGIPISKRWGMGGAALFRELFPKNTHFSNSYILKFSLDCGEGR